MTGLDTIRPAGGPTQPVSQPSGLASIINAIYEYFSPRELSIGVASVEKGQLINFPINASSLGDISAVSFTLEFEVSKLQNPTVLVSPNSPADMVVTVNSDNAKDGRIGVLIEMPTPIADGTGFISIIFESSDDAFGSSAVVRFSDSVAPKSASDAIGTDAAIRFVDRAIKDPR